MVLNRILGRFAFAVSAQELDDSVLVGSSCNCHRIVAVSICSSRSSTFLKKQLTDLQSAGGGRNHERCAAPLPDRIHIQTATDMQKNGRQRARLDGHAKQRRERRLGVDHRSPPDGSPASRISPAWRRPGRRPPLRTSNATRGRGGSTKTSAPAGRLAARPALMISQDVGGTLRPGHDRIGRTPVQPPPGACQRPTVG